MNKWKFSSLAMTVVCAALLVGATATLWLSNERIVSVPNFIVLAVCWVAVARMVANDVEYLRAGQRTLRINELWRGPDRRIYQFIGLRGSAGAPGKGATVGFEFKGIDDNPVFRVVPVKDLYEEWERLEPTRDDLLRDPALKRLSEGTATRSDIARIDRLADMYPLYAEAKALFAPWSQEESDEVLRRAREQVAVDEGVAPMVEMAVTTGAPEAPDTQQTTGPDLPTGDYRDW